VYNRVQQGATHRNRQFAAMARAPLEPDLRGDNGPYVTYQTTIRVAMVFMNIALLRGSIALYSYTQRLPFKQKYNDPERFWVLCAHENSASAHSSSRLRPTRRTRELGLGFGFFFFGRGTLLQGAEVAQPGVSPSQSEVLAVPVRDQLRRDAKSWLAVL